MKKAMEHFTTGKGKYRWRVLNISTNPEADFPIHASPDSNGTKKDCGTDDRLFNWDMVDDRMTEIEAGRFLHLVK